MPRLSVPLTDDQHAAIRRKAGALGVPQAEVARRLLLAWANNELAMPIPKNYTVPDYPRYYKLTHEDPDFDTAIEEVRRNG